MKNKNLKTLKESSLKGVALRPRGASRIPAGRLYRISVAICSVIVTAVIGYLIVRAGDLNPVSGPTEPTMKTLEDIYCAMSIDCTAASSTLDSPASPTSTMRTLQEIYDKAVRFPIPDTGQVTCYAVAGSVITCGNSPAGQDAEYDSTDSFACDMSYTPNGDGTATDNCTGLMWKTCSEGQTYGAGPPEACSGTGSYLWADALSQCEGLTFAGESDWRLPNAKELFSIVLEEYPAITGVKAEGAPYINQTVFPTTVSGFFWSCTTYPYSTALSLGVNFEYGTVGPGNRPTGQNVRCVRGQ